MTSEDCRFRKSRAGDRCAIGVTGYDHVIIIDIV